MSTSRSIYQEPNEMVVRKCPLCLKRENVILFCSDKSRNPRDFCHCVVCDLVFVPPEFHIDRNSEIERYLQHNNDPYDQGYRDFLSRLMFPTIDRLTIGDMGLDYGAGPGPALAIMMREEGFGMEIYDPNFHPSGTLLQNTYDFVTCSETVEHFSSPRVEFDRFQSILRPGGLLAIMTGMLDNWTGFPEWYYHRDPTHIAFYSEKTMMWIAADYCWSLEMPDPNIALFRKSAGDAS